MGQRLIQVPAQIIDFRPRADRSYRIAFETRQLSGEELAILGDNFHGEGWLVFSPNELQAEDVPVTDADAGVKSPSQRLRSVLYVWWQQLGSPGSFEVFYQTQYSKLIEYVKEKLDGQGPAG